MVTTNMHDDVAEFQSRMSAAQDLRDRVKETGQRLMIDALGYVRLWHGTSKAAMVAIQASGVFHAGTFFAASRSATEPHARPKHGKDTVQIEIHVDPRHVEFSTGTGEFYVPGELSRDQSGRWCSPRRHDELAAFSSEDYLFHVTPAHQLTSIFASGLTPACGDRSQDCGEHGDRIYFFTSFAALTDALMNWMADAFDEDECMAVLAVHRRGIADLSVTDGAEYEATSVHPVPPQAITLITRDIDADGDLREAVAQALAPGSIACPLAPEAMEHAPAGAWVFAGYTGLRGRPVYQVRDLDVDALVLPELDHDGLLQPEKRRDLPEYVARAAAGEVPPNITVIEREDGSLAVVDGHRRVMAARAAGVRTIRACVSPLVALDGEGFVTLTHELAMACARSGDATGQVDDEAPEAPGPRTTRCGPRF